MLRPPGDSDSRLNTRRDPCVALDDFIAPATAGGICIGALYVLVKTSKEAFEVLERYWSIKEKRLSTRKLELEIEALERTALEGDAHALRKPAHSVPDLSTRKLKLEVRSLESTSPSDEASEQRLRTPRNVALDPEQSSNLKQSKKRVKQTGAKLLGLWMATIVVAGGLLELVNLAERSRDAAIEVKRDAVQKADALIGSAEGAVSEFRTDVPMIVDAQLQTNAVAHCRDIDAGDETADDSGQTFPVPFQGGPSVRRGPNAAGWAQTDANVRTKALAPGKVQYAVEVVNKVGGTCASHGAGGDGRVAPFLTTEIVLPLGGAWKVTARLLASGSGVANVPADPGPLKDVKLRIGRLGEYRELAAPRDGQAKETQLTLSPGRYTIILECPAIQRGCYGASIGSSAEGVASTTLSLVAEQGS